MAKIIDIKEWEQIRSSREEALTVLINENFRLFDLMMAAYRANNSKEVLTLGDTISENSNKIKQLKENIRNSK